MKILITGDSWASGDWNGTVNQEYFSPILVDLLKKDSHNVIHCSYPGKSDLFSLNSVKKYANDVDFIIFFKTQTTRLIIKETSVKYNFVKGENWPTFIDYEKNNFSNVDDILYKDMISFGFHDYQNFFIDYVQEQKNLNKTFYKLSNKLVYQELYKNSHKILLIGGIEDINTEYKFKYCVKSLIESLTGCKHNNYTLSTAEEFKIFYRLISELKIDLETKNHLLKELLEIYDNSNQLFRVGFKKNNNFFGPNDPIHPNSIAIKYYYQELIKPKLKEFENDYRTAI